MMKEITINPEKSRIFQDLVEFSGLPAELVLKRCQYAVAELAIRWHQCKGVLNFYQEEDLYLFDLTKYQLLLEFHDVVKRMIEQIQSLGLTKVLEFGGGIGEFSLRCAEAGIPVTYYELDGVIKDYALWRFDKHKTGIKTGLSGLYIVEVNPLPENWDVVNVMDVLEHLEKPEEAIAQLRRHTRYIFCNPEDVKYNDYYPQHIGKFDLTPHFERQEGYLWKNKEL